MKIFLLGLPGSGKTTLGKEVSVALSIPFVDLDLEIESAAGKKIREIFEDQGEMYFRDLESSVLSTWCLTPTEFVMATGGGTPCFLKNIDLINRSGQSVFLDVPSETIADRIRLDGLQERPLLASLKPEELVKKIQLLRSNRLSFYRQAHACLTGATITSGDIIAWVEKR